MSLARFEHIIFLQKFEDKIFRNSVQFSSFFHRFMTFFALFVYFCLIFKRTNCIRISSSFPFSLSLTKTSRTHYTPTKQTHSHTYKHKRASTHTETKTQIETDTNKPFLHILILANDLLPFLHRSFSFFCVIRKLFVEFLRQRLP